MKSILHFFMDESLQVCPNFHIMELCVGSPRSAPMEKEGLQGFYVARTVIYLFIILDTLSQTAFGCKRSVVIPC